MDDPGSPTPPESQSITPDGLAEFLAQHLASLADVLMSVDDNPRLIDASLEDVHEIAARLAKVVKRQVFGHPDFAAEVLHWDIGGMFEHARTNESDNYEVYADDLERHQRRQGKDLAVADSDADKFAIVKRRRAYLETLFDLNREISGIIDILRA